MPIYRDPRQGRIPEMPPASRPVIRAATPFERLRDRVDDTLGPAMQTLAKIMGLDTPQGQLEATFPNPMGPAVPAMTKVARGAGNVLKPSAQQLLDYGGDALQALRRKAPAIIAERGDKPLNVAVAMEQFGHTRDAFRNLGHNAVSIDLMPDRMGSPHHIQDDVFKVLEDGTCGPLDMVLGHPSCTYLTSSGIHWNDRGRGWEQTEAAIKDFLRLYNTPAAEHVAVENPVGIMSSRFRPADQYIQPYEFGSDASKKTGLWLRDLPALQKDPDLFVPGREVVDPKTGKVLRRWANQTDSGQNRLGPSLDRAMQRAQTYPGVAKAMAEQWSDYLLRLRHARARQ